MNLLHPRLRLRRPHQCPSPSFIIRHTTTFPNKNNTKNRESPPTVVSTGSLVSAYAQLAKARLSALVVATTAAGYVASGGTDIFVATGVVTGTALCSAAAAASNQISEIDADARMHRTRQRPTVTGIISPSSGRIAVGVWGVSGVGVLYGVCDPVTAALGAANMVLYAGIYTPMKRVTIYNTWVGAVVGAIPPVMGCTAAAAVGEYTGTAACLALTLYYWQLVHFLALSHMYRVDYARGGFEMLGVHDTQATAASIVRNAYGLTIVPPVLAYITGATSGMYVVESVVLNSYMLYLSHQFQDDSSNQKARRVFLNSLWYLPCSLILFCWHSRGLQDALEKEKEISKEENILHSLRDWGRRHCVHEQNAVHECCPVTHDLPAKVADAATETTTTLARSTSSNATEPSR